MTTILDPKQNLFILIEAPQAGVRSHPQLISPLLTGDKLIVLFSSVEALDRFARSGGLAGKEFDRIAGLASLRRIIPQLHQLGAAGICLNPINNSLLQRDASLDELLELIPEPQALSEPPAQPSGRSKIMSRHSAAKPAGSAPSQARAPRT